MNKGGTLRCLSIRQPWAWLIVSGHKPVENRGWETRYTGPLLIHASKQLDMEGWRWVAKNFPTIEIPSILVLGEIIGQVELDACLPVDCTRQSPWAFGPYCWYMSHPIEFKKPVPYKGQLGIFDVPDSILKEIGK